MTVTYMTKHHVGDARTLLKLHTHDEDFNDCQVQLTQKNPQTSSCTSQDDRAGNSVKNFAFKCRIYNQQVVATSYTRKESLCTVCRSVV